MKRLFVVAFVAVAAFAQPGPAPATDEFSKAVYFGKKFFDIKDYAAAYQQFVKADALQPDNPAVLYNMALLLAKTGQFADAAARVERYNHLYPNGLEKALIAKLQLELEFEQELQKRKQADEEYGELFTRGLFLYGKGDLDAALKVFQEAAQKRPNDPVAVYDEALLYEKLGDFSKSLDRFRRYEELEPNSDQKIAIGQRLLFLDSELTNMRTKIVCAFCGFRLPIGATWCPRCWRGPYLTSSPVWNSRPCIEGAAATRSSYFADDRLARNDALPCMFNGTMLDALRYTPAKQRAIQEARKAEGWRYDGDVIQGWRDKQGSEVQFVQGPTYLERIVSAGDGQILTFVAHPAGDSGAVLLDREDLVLDNQKYTSRYTFDANNRITQQAVEYQNAAACDHLIRMVAEYAYDGEKLTGAKITGGYEGYAVEGAPRVQWTVNDAMTYDAAGRLAKEDLTVASMTKVYTQKPHGNARDEVARLFPAMRVNRPLENILRTGDLCATAGNQILGNVIDLRPFYALSPNIAVTIPFGVTRANASFTYPDSFRPR